MCVERWGNLTQPPLHDMTLIATVTKIMRGNTLPGIIVSFRVQVCAILHLQRQRVNILRHRLVVHSCPVPIVHAYTVHVRPPVCAAPRSA
jgi:hypothetical protein